MKHLALLHRGLSGASLALLSAGLAGLPIPYIISYTVIMITMIFYLGELLLLTIMAISHPKHIDIIYPVVMLITTTVALRALISGNIVLSAIPITIMFISGYMGKTEVKEDESSRVHKSEQSR